MILYVNGDSHAAGAEAVNTFAFAEDDPQYTALGRQPHPDNFAVSWPKLLADKLQSDLVCEAESGSSNHKIMRNVYQLIEKQRGNYSNLLIVIGWSTWERIEIKHNDKYYQFGASGLDHVPDELQGRYKRFIARLNYVNSMVSWHRIIYNLHELLRNKGIKHFFFNCNSHFRFIDNRARWNNCYLDPYNPDRTMDRILRKHKFSTVNPDSWHFGADAHCFWSDFVLHYLNTNNLIPK